MSDEITYGVPCEYRENLEKKLKEKYKDWGIDELSELVCHKCTERVLSVAVDNKIHVYTHREDFDLGYVVGVDYVFHKNGKFAYVKVV